MAKKAKEELKVTRGWSLTPANVMALQAEAFERTIARSDGGTVSGSEVLDEIVTEWRQKNALKDLAGGVVLSSPVIVVKKERRKA